MGPQDEPLVVPVVDLDEAEKTPEDVVYEWDAKIRKRLGAFALVDNQHVLGDLMKDYLESLQEINRLYEDNECLRKKVICHLKFLYTYYNELVCYTSDIYLGYMEDILTEYCNIELEVINHLAKKNKSGLKPRQIVSIAKRINYSLTVYLLERHDRILHVLIKMNTDNLCDSCTEVLNYIFFHFLTRGPTFSKSEESFCRHYILYEKWKQIRPKDDWKEMDDILYKRFKKTPELITKSDYLRSVITPLTHTTTDIVYNCYRGYRSIASAYFSQYHATRNRELDEIPFNIDLDDDTQDSKGEDDIKGEKDCDDLDEDAKFTSALFQFERNLRELPRIIEVDTAVRNLKQEASDDDDDVVFVSEISPPPQPIIVFDVKDDEPQPQETPPVTTPLEPIRKELPPPPPNGINQLHISALETVHDFPPPCSPPPPPPPSSPPSLSPPKVMPVLTKELPRETRTVTSSSPPPILNPAVYNGYGQPTPPFENEEQQVEQPRLYASVAPSDKSGDYSGLTPPNDSPEQLAPPTVYSDQLADGIDASCSSDDEDSRKDTMIDDTGQSDRSPVCADSELYDGGVVNGQSDGAPKILFTSDSKIVSTTLSEFNRFEVAARDKWDAGKEDNRELDEMLNGPVSGVIVPVDGKESEILGEERTTPSPNDMSSPVFEDVDDFRDFFSGNIEMNVGQFKKPRSLQHHPRQNNNVLNFNQEPMKHEVTNETTLIKSALRRPQEPLQSNNGQSLNPEPVKRTVKFHESTTFEEPHVKRPQYQLQQKPVKRKVKFRESTLDKSKLTRPQEQPQSNNGHNLNHEPVKRQVTFHEATFGIAELRRPQEQPQNNNGHNLNNEPVKRRVTFHESTFAIEELRRPQEEPHQNNVQNFNEEEVMGEESTWDESEEWTRLKNGTMVPKDVIELKQISEKEPKVALERLSFLERAVKNIMKECTKRRVDYDKSTNFINQKDVVRSLSPPHMSCIYRNVNGKVLVKTMIHWNMQPEKRKFELCNGEAEDIGEQRILQPPAKRKKRGRPPLESKKQQQPQQPKSYSSENTDNNKIFDKPVRADWPNLT